MKKKVILKPRKRLVESVGLIDTYAYSYPRCGIQTIQLLAASKKCKIEISKISPMKAIFYIYGQEEEINQIFTTLAITDFSDKFKWKFRI